nr:MAG TPA: hypothetical protein [Caudoviricetes sp.]DAX83175.1 MAG TPA: hypothetical protein [Caudoviricetes sp.]
MSGFCFILPTFQRRCGRPVVSSAERSKINKNYKVVIKLNPSNAS